jgi:hypothetical protein
MKTSITAEISRIKKLIEQAEVKADSENEATAARYETVIELLEAAL